MDDQKVLCPHCGNSVTKKTLCAHKRLYYDNDTGQWIKKMKSVDCKLASYIPWDLSPS